MKSAQSATFSKIASLFALALLGASSVPVNGQFVWSGGPGTWDNEAGNTVWNTPTAAGVATGWVGGSASVAIFNNNGAANVVIGDNLEIGALQFNTVNSGPYTFLNNGGWTIDFTGAGISSISNNTQVVSSDGIINFSGNNTTAGNSRISVTNNSSLNFLNTATTGGATAGSATITNTSTVSFNGDVNFATVGPTAGNATINNSGIVEFVGKAQGGTATIVNTINGLLNLEGTTLSTVTLGSLTSGPGSGVVVGKTTLQLGELSLITSADYADYIDFTLESNSVGTGGTIVLNAGGEFDTSGIVAGKEVEIRLTYTPGQVLAGTYDLIDFSAATSFGSVDLSDFKLASLPPYAGATLAINSNKLQLVVGAHSVPDGGSTLLLLGAVVGGLFFFAPRRLASC